MAAENDNAEARAADLYLQTHATLKREIEDAVSESRSNERHALLGAAAIWTYLASRCPNPVPDIFWYLPVALIVFGAVRCAALMLTIRPRARYLKRLEVEVFRLKPAEGWETYFRQHYWPVVGVTMWLFWLGLLCVALVIPRVLPTPLCVQPPNKTLERTGG